MHAVIRTYSGKGAKELFDVLEKRKADVEKLKTAQASTMDRAIGLISDDKAPVSKDSQTEILKEFENMKKEMERLKKEVVEIKGVLIISTTIVLAYRFLQAIEGHRRVK